MPSRRVKFNDLLVKIVADDRLTKVMKRVQKLIKGTAALATKTTAIVAAIGTGAFAVAIAKSTEFGATIARTSAQLALGSDKFQEYFNAAKFTDAKIDVVDFGDALKDVVERITEANTLGEGDLFDSASAIGLNTDLRESGEIIDDLILKMGRLSEEDRLFRTRELVGDSSFEQLSGLLSLSTERLQGLISESKKLGLIITPENLQNLSEAKRSIGVLKQILTTLGAEIAADIAPRLVKLTLYITEFIKANGGVGKFLEQVFNRIKFEISELRLSIDSLPGIDLDLTAAEKELQRYNAIQERTRHTTEGVVAIGARLRQTIKDHVTGDKDRTKQIEKLTSRLQQLKKVESQQLATLDGFNLEVRPEFDFVMPEISPEKINEQMELLFRGSEVQTRVPLSIEPDVKIDPAKIEKNIEPLKAALSNNIIDTAQGVSDAIGPAFGPAVRSLLEASLEGIGNAAGEDAANATVEGFNAAVGLLARDALDIQKVLSTEELCVKAEEAGSKAASCLTRSFQQSMENVQTVLNTAGNLLGGFESLLAAGEAKEIDRISRAKARNATELDILKTRLDSSKNLTNSEIALYNRQVSSIKSRDRSLDIAAQAAEAKACKRAKKFAILQGAIAVASAWAAAAKAGSFAAGAGPVAFFAGFGSVLAAGLGAAAQIAKFDCNKIGSTSGTGGSGGGATGGSNAGGASTPNRAGADLGAFDSTRMRPQKIVNLTITGDRISTDDVVDIVQQINEGESQINVDRVAGVF